MSGRGAKLAKFESKFVRQDLPKFNVGDTVKMKIKVQEADKIRLHPWEGVVIAKRGSGVCEAFTVRKVSYGEGVEKTFPVNSPVIESMKVAFTGKVKRAKLFNLRKGSAKKNRIESTAVTTA